MFSLASTHFPVTWLHEFAVKSRRQLQPDKFECSYNLFAGYCMHVIERSYFSITSGG